MNGLRSPHDEIQLLLRDHGIRIIIINETKLDPSYSKQLTRISGFEHESKDRTSNGGGVAIYIKDSRYKLRNDIPDCDLELIYVEILPPKATSYFLVAWYPLPSDPNESFNMLELILSFLDNEEKEVISPKIATLNTFHFFMSFSLFISSLLQNQLASLQIPLLLFIILLQPHHRT